MQIQPYLDEFVFQFYQRADETIFDDLLRIMINAQSVFIKNLNLYWGS